MNPKRTIRSIWDIDPNDIEEHEYEEFEELFSAAYKHAFKHTPSTRQIWSYLQRYFRFRVIPPWVRDYVKTVQGGDGIDNIGNAPLDPVFDLQPWFERLSVLFFFGRASSSRDDNSTFEA